MKKSVLAFLSSVLALVIVSTTMTAPAQAGPLDCSLGGSFFLSNGGQWLESSTSNCAGEVVIPASVTELGPNAFKGRNITNVTFEAGSALSSLSGFGYSTITSIVIPPTTTTISWEAFVATSLRSLTVPGRVNSILDDVLGANLETLILEPRIGTVSLGIGRFNAGSKLSSIIVNGPSRVHAIGGGFVKEGMNFKGWSESVGGPLISFPHIVTAGDVKTLYPVFTPKVVQVYNCSLSGTFTTTDDVLTSATSDCAGQVTIPTAVTQVNNVFNGRAITSVLFPSDSMVTSFASNALQNMPFTSIVLPPNMTSINGEAMRGNKLTSISYPGKLSGFGYNGLGPEVETITFESRIEPNYWIDNAFLARAINIRSITFNSATTWPAIRPNNKPLYEWLGWSATVDGPVLSLPRSIVGTIYSRWQPKVYTATFNSNGGNEATTTSSIILGVIQQFPAPPTRARHTFLGWYDNVSGSGTAITEWMQDSNQTFYAKWRPDWAVNFNSNGGSAVAAESFPSGGQLLQAPTAPTRQGYSFAGWSATNGGAAISFPYTPGVTTAITLFAKWTPTLNAVNFDSKGGSAVSPSSFLTEGAISAAPVAPTRPGYSFAGWSRTDGGSVISFPHSPGATAAITLFAKWTANTYLANLLALGGSAVSARSFVSDGAIALAPPSSTRSGYTFDGWSATEGGEAVTFPYSPGVYSNISLYARWLFNYAVNFDSNGGTPVPAGFFPSGRDVAQAPTAPTRQGYSFVSWSATDGGEAISFPYTPGVVENITLYAEWLGNTNAVNFDSKGGSSVEAGSFRSGGAVWLAPEAPTLAGYTFAGWSATDGGDAVSFPYSPSEVEAITLYAIWDANTYSVTLNTTGGLAMPSISFRTAGQIASAPAIPVRVGYTFVGWALTDGGTALSFPYAPGVIENITLFANWTRDPFKPELIAGDVIAGTGIQSTLLSAAGGSWLAYPEAVVSHQWYRCDKAVAAGLSVLPTASKCVKITGATAANYKVAVPDAGKYLTALVEAKNRIGSTFLTVATFRAPPLKAPSKIALPVGTGTAKASSYLTGTLGTWVGNPVPKTTVQWYRCENATAASAKAVPGSAQCEAIRGATKTRYKLGTADKGKYVTVQITAKNTEGEAISTAKSQRVILDPTLVENPEISGAAGLNKSLSANKGTWLAYPTAKTTLQWYRCNRATSPGAKSFSGSSGCKAIAGATRSSYRTGAADEGKYISVLVKATNSAGTKSVTTRSTDKIE